MSSLLPHQHRSTSDRLLNNYLSSQKQLTTALLTLLSHSHSSTSSLLAYVTSSSGVSYPVRRSVQNAAFEGPINSDQLYSGGDDARSLNSNGGGNGPEAKWHVYISSLEKFRKELKEVHQLEEELSQVKRDREILVSRLIKATKSRPTKADIAAAASDSGSRRNRDSHNGSVLSFGSDGSGTTAGGAGRSKRAEKLAEAQAEVLGCEEHLRSLEVRLEEERNKVMRHGLMERFRAMEDVGRMWQHQARLGMAELERPNGPDGPLLPPNAYEVDSNSSLAPSHSASQVGYGSDGEVEQRRPRGNNGNKNHGRGGRVPGMGGSVTGSIAEEDEGSSSDDGGNLVVHENKRPGLAGMENTIAARSQSTIVPNGGGDNRRGGAGQGVPSITAIRAKPPTQRQHSGSSSSSGGGGGRRRTQSELGYHPPRARQQNRMSLRRTYSGGAKSDDSSVRGGQTGKKKGGFFRSLARLFKTKPGGGSTVSNNRPKAGRRGSDSPPLGQRNRSGWSTRTDTNIKRASSTSFGSRGGVGGRRRDDDGSSSDEGYSGGLVAVTNRGNNTWSVDNVGKVPAPQGKKTRSDLGAGAKGRNNSSSTITPAGQAKTVSKPPAAGSQPVSRSNTVKSNASGVDAKRTRQGSITRARNNALATSPSISSVLGGGPGSAAGKKTGSAAGAPIGSTVTAPKMAEIPKAPKSQVTPQMFMATAPPPTATGLLQPPPTSAPASMDSLVPKKTASSVSRSTITPAQTAPAPAKEVAKPIAKPAALPPKSASRPASKQLAGLDLGAPIGMTQENPSIDSFMQRTSTPLPPSKTLSPPAKSAFRAASPQPPSSPVNEIPQPAFLVSAPGSSIQAKKEEPVVEKPVERPAEVIKQHEAPAYQDRPETPMTMTEENESIYESAVEEDAVDGESPAKPKTRAVRGYGIDADDASSVASESTASPGDAGRYKVVENTEGLAARLKQVGGERSRPVESVGAPPTPPEPAPEPMQDVVAPAPASVVESGVERRKSVRMNVPDSPAPTPSAEQVTFPSRVNGNADGGWSSRVGKGGDSSEEEDNAAYAKAKRNLQRFSSLSATTSPAKKTKRKSKA